jgi:hypothetical protein
MVRQRPSRSTKEAAPATPAAIRIDEKTVQQSGNDSVSMGAPRIARPTAWASSIHGQYHAYLEADRERFSH